MDTFPNWKTPRYLAAGTSRQRHTHAVLEDLGILTTLSAFDPVVTGTIPLGIDLPSSDIDIICEVAPADERAFEQLLRTHYGHQPAFQIGRAAGARPPALVSSFCYLGTEIEVFGQALPTARQYAFRHLVVEHAVLRAGGPAWCTAVRRLKAQGAENGTGVCCAAAAARQPLRSSANPRKPIAGRSGRASGSSRAADQRRIKPRPRASQAWGRAQTAGSEDGDWC
jgi:hypothetical protein